MKLSSLAKGIILSLTCIAVVFALQSPVPAGAADVIRIFVDGKEINPDVPPVIISDRTMVPIRAISEGLGMEVQWDNSNRRVLINSPYQEVSGETGKISSDIAIMGNSVATAEDLRKVLMNNNPAAPQELAELYIKIGSDYGIRGDIAFCQAAKETGWFKYGGLVQSFQNNYCGLGATGKAATGEESLNGADPSRVRYENACHGAIFDCPASGVEAHIQHLYAYACTAPLPEGKNLVDPRFTLVRRGIANTWSDLNGRWAVPGIGYGESILNDYYAKVLAAGEASQATSQDIKQLQIENQLLKMEIQRLQKQISSGTRV